MRGGRFLAAVGLALSAYAAGAVALLARHDPQIAGAIRGRFEKTFDHKAWSIASSATAATRAGDEAASAGTSPVAPPSASVRDAAPVRLSQVGEWLNEASRSHQDVLRQLSRPTAPNPVADAVRRQEAERQKSSKTTIDRQGGEPSAPVRQPRSTAVPGLEGLANWLHENSRSYQDVIRQLSRPVSVPASMPETARARPSTPSTSESNEVVKQLETARRIEAQRRAEEALKAEEARRAGRQLHDDVARAEAERRTAEAALAAAEDRRRAEAARLLEEARRAKATKDARTAQDAATFERAEAARMAEEARAQAEAEAREAETRRRAEALAKAVEERAAIEEQRRLADTETQRLAAERARQSEADVAAREEAGRQEEQRRQIETETRRRAQIEADRWAEEETRRRAEQRSLQLEAERQAEARRRAAAEQRTATADQPTGIVVPTIETRKKGWVERRTEPTTDASPPLPVAKRTSEPRQDRPTGVVRPTAETQAGATPAPPAERPTGIVVATPRTMRPHERAPSPADRPRAIGTPSPLRTTHRVAIASTAPLPVGRAIRRRDRCRDAGAGIAPPGWYVVKRGDSLWRIAFRHYYRGRLYHAVYDRNIDRIDDPDLIFPCQRVYLPRLRIRG